MQGEDDSRQMAIFTSLVRDEKCKIHNHFVQYANSNCFILLVSTEFMVSYLPKLSFTATVFSMVFVPVQ